MATQVNPPIEPMVEAPMLGLRYWLQHKLFGWDYINWNNSADSGIARVFRTPDGRVLYFRYKLTKLIDEIKSPEQVIWLTCHPSKFFGVKDAS